MQGNTFSPAKITLPRLRASMVARPQLESWLREALASCKLVLLTAPAGYGKTVALVQQLSRLPQGHAVAWVSASGDDDLQRLLTALLAALDPFDLPWRISPQALPEMALNPQQLGTAVGALAGALLRADVEHGVMAFDDLHCVADPRVFKFLDRLLEVLPANWTVAITSRVDPPLALARLLVGREAAEFRQSQLRFQREDVQALLETAGLAAAAPEHVDRLLEHTQGWPAGLSVEMLAREHMPREHSTRVQRRMFDYLAQEVLQQLPPPLQSFLLRCSVLAELGAERCAQVSGDPDAARWLAELERRELFVTVLDTEALTLRLHDLFREFLQARLTREHFEELPQLLHRAAEGEPDLVPRVGYLLRAGAAQEAAQQMLEAAATMIQTGAGEQLPRLIEQFPEPLRETSAELAYVRGLWAWHRFELRTMHGSMLKAMAGFERNEQRQPAIRARGWAAVALSMLGRLTEASRLWDEVPRVEMEGAAEAIGALLAFLRSGQYGPWESTGAHLAHLVQLFRALGSDEWPSFFNTLSASVGRWGVRPAMEDLVDALRAASGDARPLMKLSALRLQAWLTLWRGDIDTARDLCREVMTEAGWLGNPPHVVIHTQVLIALERHLSGDHAKSQEILRRVADAAAHSPQRRAQIFYVNLLAGLACAREDWPAARQALLTIDPAAEHPWVFVEVQLPTLRAELALHAHQDAEALALLRPLVDRATQGDAFGVSYRLRVALARAELRAGTAQAAWEVLGPALHEAMKAGEPLGFLLCGAKALDELAQAHWPTAADAPALAYLRECASRARQLRASTSESAPAQAVGGPLSEREREVLELVAQGQSNKLIARGLNLSPHTVKRHMARIFDKTGQSSRGQVAAWYRGETGRRAAVD